MYSVWLINFLATHAAISQLLMAGISFNIACKELNIAQISQVQQLFQLWNLVHICSCMATNRKLMRRNVNYTYDISKDYYLYNDH